MSWTTGVVLIVGLGEYYDDETGDCICEEPEALPAVKEINAWLGAWHHEKLTNLSEKIQAGKSMPAEIFAGVINHLKIPEFTEFVKTRDWKEPEYVQLLIKDQEDSRFTLTNLGEEKDQK